MKGLRRTLDLPKGTLCDIIYHRVHPQLCRFEPFRRSVGGVHGGVGQEEYLPIFDCDAIGFRAFLARPSDRVSSSLNLKIDPSRSDAGKDR
jgi:hypothetical protein